MVLFFRQVMLGESFPGFRRPAVVFPGFFLYFSPAVFFCEAHIMADELQALLDRITEQELKKADAEGEQLIAQAKAEATEIRQQAQAEAEETRAQAQQEADLFVQKGEESLRQAARDVLLSLRTELEKRVVSTIEKLMQEQLAGENLAMVIAAMVTQFVARQGDTDNLQVLLSQEEFSTLEKTVKAKLVSDLRERVELAPSSAVTGGFKLIFRDSGVMYDFTDQALAEALSAYLSPQISAKL